MRAAVRPTETESLAAVTVRVVHRRPVAHRAGTKELHRGTATADGGRVDYISAVESACRASPSGRGDEFEVHHGLELVLAG